MSFVENPMSRLKIAIVIITLSIGLILRLHNYSIYPQRGASSDEYTYSFLGISLLTRGVPESWSNLNVYPFVQHLTIKKLYFPMVSPYFDHPPLNGLLVGGWSILNNEASFEKVELHTIRLVPIFLSIISSVLVFLLGLKLFDYKTAVWALLIYSTATVFVINQRVVFAENLLTPLVLGAICLYVYAKKLTTKITIGIGLLAGASFWTKELGIAVFFTMLYLFLHDRQKIKSTLLLIGIFLAFFIGYVGYGYYYDGILFWKVILTQSSRPIGPETVLLLTQNPIIVNKVYYDGWYFFGFISIFFALFDFNKYKILLAPSFIYFMFIVFSINKTGEMGWYMIPLFPFMALFSASFLKESLTKQKSSWFIFLLLIFVGLYEIRYLYGESFGLTSMQFRILLLVLFGPFIILKLFNKNNAFKMLGNIWFYLLILGSAFLTYNYIHPS